MRPHRIGRGVVRALIVGLLATGGMLVLASPAQAHATLTSAEPQPGYTVPSATRLVLSFDESVAVSRSSLRLSGPGGPVDLTVATGTTTRLIGTPERRLPQGGYTVRWSVTAEDGDVITGTYVFGVRALTATGTQTGLQGPRAAAGTAGLASAAVLRWVLFTALAVALGGLAGTRILNRLQSYAANALPAWRGPPVTWASAAGAGAALLLAVHAAGQGTLLSGFATGPGRWLGTPAGHIAAVEVGLFGAAALTYRTRHPGLAAAPLLAVALAEGFRNHLRATWGPAGIAVIAVHLAAAATWAGALLTVAVGAWQWRSGGRVRAAWSAVADYARLALWLYLVTVATGSAAAIALVGSWSNLTDTDYGKVLITKIVLVTGVSALALTSRLLLGRTPPGRRPAPVPSTRLEVAVLAAVIAATGGLVSLAAPVEASSQVALPPPAPVGPVVRLGNLAGNLTVGLSASAGQLRLKVLTPASDDGEKTAILVKATLSDAVSPPRRVRLSPCGQGCFAAPVIWRQATLVTVDASARHWHGGQARFDVPWPPAPGTAVLARTIPVMQRVRRLLLREEVTSDTTRPAGAAQSLSLSGADFLAAEPFHAAPSDAFLLPSAGRSVRVGFAVSDTYYVELTVDQSGRITDETLTSPNHLIRRAFTYRD